MRNRYILFCALSIRILGISIAPIQAEGEGELWAKEVLSAPFLELHGIGPTTLNFENENRWNDGISEHYRTHFQSSIEIPLPILESWSFEPGYRRQTVEPGQRDQVHQDRYLLNLNKEVDNLCGSEWDFSFRNRWEVLDNDDGSDEKFRTRFRGKLAKEIGCLETGGRAWKFWVLEEAFYPFEEGRISDNRVASGIDIPVSEQSTISIGYQWEISREPGENAGWDDDHHLLFEFRYNFLKSPFGR